MSGKRTAVSSLDGVTSSSPGELGTPAPALVARTVEIDPARVEDLLALLPTDDPVSWVRRDEGLVGWGRAAELRTAGASRFDDAAAVELVADDAQLFTDCLHFGIGLFSARAFPGFRFHYIIIRRHAGQADPGHCRQTAAKQEDDPTEEEYGDQAEDDFGIPVHEPNAQKQLNES